MYALSEAEHLMLHDIADKHAKLLADETGGGAADVEETCEAFYDFAVDHATRLYDPAHKSGASLATYANGVLEGHRTEVKKAWLAKEAHNVSIEVEVADEPHLDLRASMGLYLEVCRALTREEQDLLWALTIADGNVEDALELLKVKGRLYGRSTFYATTVPTLKEKVLCLTRR